MGTDGRVDQLPPLPCPHLGDQPQPGFMDGIPCEVQDIHKSNMWHANIEDTDANLLSGAHCVSFAAPFEKKANGQNIPS